MEEGACLVMKDIGKPCTGKPYARFDEGGQGNLLSTLPVTSPARWKFKVLGRGIPKRDFMHVILKPGKQQDLIII